MNCQLILFSPTGGTEKAARILCSSLGGEARTFDLSDRNFRADAFEADSSGVAVIAMPSFGGRVPAVAAERLSGIRGGGMPCVALCVYGNRAYEDALVEMADLARACGFRLVAAVAAIAQHSIMRQYATGRPDARDKESLREIGGRISLKLAQPQDEGDFFIPGNRPYRKAGGAGLLPRATSACTGCGLCADLCPTGAIDAGSLKKPDRAKCISCMRCVAKCPHGARAVNGAMVSVAAWTIRSACSARKECECYL